MLTDNQQKLIEDLKNEFSKMNTPIPSAHFTLLNKFEMDRKFYESNKRKSELQCITNATDKAVADLMNTDIKRLNRDLVAMGLIAQLYNQTNNYVYIDTLEKKEFPCYDIMFQYRKSSIYENLPDGDSITYYTGFNSIGWKNYAFRSIDKMCLHEEFIKTIENKYKSTLK